ncbi:type II toxin-antitoxin system HicB family antitoxin [Sphingomonas ginsenosidivorax]|uniref:Type II toxin-antitoxin system HicB family antitoxin n=1 Tax=Sphingomonas ginsenosidivorax TaxID=862135 RepID=A0A5C6U8W2_9SPHN|nr:type II toxin-antitoxin system HicB family antitoxin [Sphingomonas ginsenosidivorax]TXC69557.1 type II toxin-antitoxin system HicB family antitoxin [Sphingomonas ginsenosidivorax]
MSEPRYHINLFWSQDDDCWIADVPDLRYCTTHGDTSDEALVNVHDAIENWLEAAQATGIAIPVPSYRPDIYATRFAA